MLFVVEKQKFKKYASILNAIRETAPVKIHDVVQTEDDLKANLAKRDKIILDILKKGVILWGHRIIVKVINDAYQG